MEKRSESDILSKAPVKLKLGEKEYKIPVLTILPAREWRLKLNASLSAIVDSFKMVETAESSAVASGLTAALIQFPEKVAELVFAYAGETLKPEEILASATEEQLAQAFSAIMQVAYPFLPQLSLVTNVMRAAPPPQLAKFTN